MTDSKTKDFDEPNIVKVSSKGQVVIPRIIRMELGISSKSKLLVYRYDDGIVLKKLSIPDKTRELQEIYKRVDERISKYGELSEEEINTIIQKYRKQK
jgi:AbrB family looped-hinge helix DNA binding protein